MNRDKSFKGFEFMLNRIKMEVKMHLLTLLFLIVMHIIAFMTISYVYMPRENWYYALKYAESSAVSYVNPNMPLEIEYQGKMMKSIAQPIAETDCV